MEESEKCPLCGNKLKHHSSSIDIMGDFFNCPQCGKYKLRDDLLTDTELVNNFHLLAGYLLEISNSENRMNNQVLNPDSFKELLNSPIIPKKISEKPLKLLRYLNRHTAEFGQEISIPVAASYAKNYNEALLIVSMLDGEGLVDDYSTDSGLAGSITYLGMKYIEDFDRKNQIIKDQAFVAMWFDRSETINTDVWEKIIKPGCEDAGYNPIRVLEREYNDSVVDEIIALIKESAFAVVDFSGYRGGVYYEAGYAKGLGKEVISLCHESWFNNPRVKNHTVHFDVNHNNFIVWKTGEEEKARIQLTNRIRATIGMGNYNGD